MSEPDTLSIPAPPPAPEPQAEPTKPAPASAAAAKPGPSTPKPRKTWGHRLRSLLITVFVIFLLFRVALHFALPTVLHRTARSYGLSATYERHEINLGGGDIGIWHLVLRPAEGGEPLLQADYCRAAISTWDLLRGRLVVRRLEAEGIDLVVERTANGEVP
jgi:hypothetical protein